MKERDYKLEDIKIGNHITFSRIGIDDFRMPWTVIGFYEGMIEVKIDEMGNSEKIHINASDIETLSDVDDTRYIDE